MKVLIDHWYLKKKPEFVQYYPPDMAGVGVSRGETQRQESH